MSQGSANVPTSGPDPPTSFAGQINTALDALFTKNSGNTSPINFPTAGLGTAQGQDWWDTSPGSGQIDERVFDGSSFVRKGRVDTTNHIWMPKVGGGSGTISGAAGGTIDIGSIPQSYLLLTGTLPGSPITSFGSNVLLNVGEVKYIRATSPGSLTYNATSMVLPGAQALNFNVGDSFEAVYLGTGNWIVFNWVHANGAGWMTGQIVPVYGTGVIPGAVRLNANTIGDASSGASEFADPTTVNLFIWLYLEDANLTVSGGRTSPGNTRAAAIIDYNLHKTIGLPDGRGRGLHSLDSGGSARITAAGGNFDGTVLGNSGGRQNLLQSALPNAQLSVSGTISAVNADTNFDKFNAGIGSNPVEHTVISTTVISLASGITASLNGNVTQTGSLPPTLMASFYIAL